MAKRRLFVILMSVVALGTLYAQEKPKKIYRPDLPGSFLLDFGVNRGLALPQNFNTSVLGSRTFNFYYHYPVQISKSRFSYNPGGGFSFERFKFSNNYSLMPQPSSDGSYILGNPADLASPITFLQGGGIKKSVLVANYFDLMPLEFRYDSRPKDLSRSFNVSIGARVGILIESHTKIKYSANGVSGTLKDKQPHGLNPFRYGLYGRVGIGNFNWFFFYNVSPYFATGKGPHNTSVDLSTTNMNTMTMGISLNGF
ncbi:MAG: outer membrane beta-barrel protein [Bacteroidetes bacterium]|nr:outer membrane beta-barrel protein [Bacteroidota bacterium]